MDRPLGVLAAAVLIVLSVEVVRAQKRPLRPPGGEANSDAHLDIRADGSYDFNYNTRDSGRHQHAAQAGAGGSPVRGEYRERDPARPDRDRITRYSAGPNGFRAAGDHIARKMDLSQTRRPYFPPVRPDSPDYKPSYSGYRDPNNDPSYKFGFKTPTHGRQEVGDNRGGVKGQYNYVDDVGELHRVQYEAGSRTGFIVRNEVPDSHDKFGPLFVQAPSRPGQRPRGRSAVRLRPDGSFDFTAAGPNLRHSEVSDAQGFRRGSYTYVDDRGLQRTVVYEAGPNIGFKIINTQKGPAPFPYHPPSYFPPYTPPGKFTTGLPDSFEGPGGLNTAESGPSVKPPKRRPGSDESVEDVSLTEDSGSSSPSRPSNKPDKDSGYSGSSEDYPYDLEHNDDHYVKPTGGYGIGEDSSSKPGGASGGGGVDEGGSSSGGGGISDEALSGAAAAGGDVSYGNCCPNPPRGRQRKPGASSRRVTRLPPIRAHVHNIDVLPHGRRLPSPGEAFERLDRAG